VNTITNKLGWGLLEISEPTLERNIWRTLKGCFYEASLVSGYFSAYDFTPQIY
jgi:hypothetical protein